MDAYYSVTKDKKHIELFFSSVPNENIREYLKLGKWRFSNINKCWFNDYTKRNEDFAIWVCNGAETKTNNKISHFHNTGMPISKEIRSEDTIIDILLEDYDKDTKLPKDLFIRNYSREKRYGINKLNIVAYKGNSYTNYNYIDIKGEVFGRLRGCSDIIIIFCAHNNEHLPIGMSSSLSFDSSELSGSFPFEKVLVLPSNEHIIDIVVQVTENPVWN